MTGSYSWKSSFTSLGLGFVVIGAILSLLGFVGLNVPQECPQSGCIYNQTLSLASLFPSGITLIIAGVLVFRTVTIAGNREQGGSS